ncbi:DUF1631 family protein [Pleionea litopenaei]|uniref:DUF1631 family protein n=1 Tax=Pleionea litopenaei TaxID=3070815 RepID=A0AA51RWJ7_9GAMM|nr:DUF1631 family protein [Pleionea sp. HL-JVS1]WMS88902.1 DUF1631 family protein [Pleionea sp. HL-JVS1]
MESEFSRIDDPLAEYLSCIVEGTGQDDINDLRTHFGEVYQNQSLWRAAINDLDNTDTTTSKNLLCFSTPLEAFIGVVDKLAAQILPLTHLHEQSPKFLRAFSLWTLRTWIQQFSTQRYLYEFQSILEFTARVLRPYDNRSGRSFEQLLETFAEIFEQHIIKTQLEEELLPLQRTLTNAFQSFQQSIRAFEQRVIQFEQQQAHNSSASLTARAIINQVTAGEKVPDWAYRFINEQWHRLFHLSLLKKEDENPIVDDGKLLLQQLVESLKLRTFEDVQSHFSKLIMPLRENIRTMFSSIAIDDNILEHFLNQLESFHIRILEGQETSDNWITIETEAQSNNQLDDEQQRKVAAQCRVGTWFTYRTNQQTYQCRVIERSLALNLVILVNYSGARVEGLKFSEAAEYLASGKFTPLSLHSQLAEKVNEISSYLLTEIQQIKTTLQEKERALTRQKVLERLELSRLERLETKKSKQQAKKRAREAEIKQQRLLAIKEWEETLKTLVSGSTFIAHELDGQIIQFVLRLNKTEKMVFVDKRGVRVGEWLPAQLAEKLVDQKIELLASRQSTEMTMEQIVASQRSKRQESTV